MKTKQPIVNLSLNDRKNLSVAASMLRTPVQQVPAVFVVQQLKAAVPVQGRKPVKVETREQAELRRERVEAITLRAPGVVVTSKWTHVTMNFDAVDAVPLRLPLLQRVWNWLRSDG